MSIYPAQSVQQFMSEWEGEQSRAKQNESAFPSLPTISRVWSGRGTPKGFKTHIEEWAFAQLSSHSPASSKRESIMVTFLSGWLAIATQSWPPQDPLGRIPDILKNPNLFSKRRQKQSCTCSQKDCLSLAWDQRLTWPWVYKLTSNWHEHGEGPKLWLWSG